MNLFQEEDNKTDQMEIVGAVKLMDGLFLGDSDSAVVKNKRKS